MKEGGEISGSQAHASRDGVDELFVPFDKFSPRPPISALGSRQQPILIVITKQFHKFLYQGYGKPASYL